MNTPLPIKLTGPLSANLSRHCWFTIPVHAGNSDCHGWHLRTADRVLPVQTHWLCRDADRGGVVRVDVVTDYVGAATLEPGAVDPTNTVRIHDDGQQVVMAAGGLDVHWQNGQWPTVRAAGRTHEISLAGEDDRGPSRHDSSAPTGRHVAENGPIRATLVLTGRLTAPGGERSLAYRLRVEAFAGLPCLVVSCWFVHDLPGVEVLQLRRLSLACSLEGQPHHHLLQLKYGLSAIPRGVVTTDALDAAVGHDGATAWRLRDASPLRDTTDYPPYLMPPSDEVAPWLAASGVGGWTAVTVDDGREMLPKGLRLDDGALTMDLWPHWASSLSLPQGRSRQVTMRLAFGADATEAVSGRTLQAGLERTSAEPLLADWHQANPAGFFDVDDLLPDGPDVAARFNRYLKQVAVPPSAIGMFDLGDTPDPGYQRTYLSTGRRLGPANPDEPAAPVPFVAGVHFAAAPWADLSRYEPIWVNNEYDVTWCIACESLRRGDASLLKPLRWYARHAIDVDFVHYSDRRWKHRCTPAHSARHTSAGAYPSHFWTEGVLAYYLLTGDEDALAFARAIADKVIEFFDEPLMATKLWHPTRELGWALLATSAVAMVDPAVRFRHISERIADELTAAPLDEAYTASMVQYSFGFASLLLGLDRWHRLSGDVRSRDWIVAAARRCAEQVPRVPSVAPTMTLMILHLGYRHSSDVALLRAGMYLLEQLLDTAEWYAPPPYAKPAAILHRPLVRFCDAAWQHGLLQDLDYRFR